MRRNLFYIVIALISIGIIALNSMDSVKYLLCEIPDNYVYTDLEVTNESVTITFDSPTSDQVFSDYEYHIEDDTLYIGVKYSMALIGNSSSSRKTVTIETDEDITTIILKGGSEEEVIYP